jgi:hypothetical protein
LNDANARGKPIGKNVGVSDCASGDGSNGAVADKLSSLSQWKILRITLPIARLTQSCVYGELFP